jgi:hypothetical protein
MASKEEMQDARKAKAAAANKKLNKIFAERNAKVPGVKKAIKAPQPKLEKKNIRNAKRNGELRVSNSQASTTNQRAKARVKDSMMEKGMKVTSSGYKTTKSNSATKPSMPVKNGVKAKVKAQGAKAMGAPTSGYGKTTKKK